MDDACILGRDLEVWFHFMFLAYHHTDPIAHCDPGTWAFFQSLGHSPYLRETLLVLSHLEFSFFLLCLTLISFWQSPWCILSKDLFTKTSTSLSSLLHQILVKFACCSQHGFLLVLHMHRSPCHHRPWYQLFLIPGCSSSWWYHGRHHSDLHLNLITEAFPRHLA